MKVKNLSIERKESYDQDYPNQLVGLVQIQGEHGKMEVKLSNAAVGKIFELIKEDVQRVSAYNASQSGHAIDEAASEVKISQEAPIPIDNDPF